MPLHTRLKMFNPTQHLMTYVLLTGDFVADAFLSWRNAVANLLSGGFGKS
jgi:hypothetical protein